MPESEEILKGLQTIVDQYTLIAIVFHIVLYLFIAALLLKWKPTDRLFGFLICLPLLSVAALAFISGNPFNGTLFTLITILIAGFSFKTGLKDVSTSPPFFMAAGIIMIIFGIVYPHFANHSSYLGYFYESPAGLIPCPTLSVITGFALLYKGFRSVAITIVITVAGLFYGIFGALKLSVLIDIVLILGSLTLLGYIIRQKAGNEAEPA